MVRLRERFDVEPLIYNLLVLAKVVDPEPVRRDLARGAFSTVILGEDVFGPRPSSLESGTLPEIQLAEIREHYRLVKRFDNLLIQSYVYQPKGERR
jgi:hypothetical protein